MIDPELAERARRVLMFSPDRGKRRRAVRVLEQQAPDGRWRPTVIDGSDVFGAQAPEVVREPPNPPTRRGKLRLLFG